MADVCKPADEVARVVFKEGPTGGLVSFAVQERPDTLHVSLESAGVMEFVSVPAPPFVTADSYERYQSLPTMPFLDLSIEWHIYAYPKRGPRIWRQEIRDGREMVGVTDCAADLKVELTYADFCTFIVGLTQLRQLNGGSRVEGSIGALSSLHWLVEQDDWLRGPRLNPNSYAAVLAGLSQSAL